MTQRLRMDDYDDYPQSGSNPFRRPWYGRLADALLGGILRWGHRLVWPLQWLVQAAARLGSALAYHLENALGQCTAWLSGTWWRLAAWLRLDVVQRQVNTLQDTAARSVDELTVTVRERTVQASWLRRLSARLAGLGHRLTLVWLRFMEWAQQSWFTRAVTSPVRWTVYLGYTLADFVLGWLWTRQYRHLLFGIPALLLVMPLAYCAVRLPFYTSEAKSRHYRRAAEEAMLVDDHGSAELYFRKLAQLGDVHERVILRSALLAAEQGRMDEAYAQMQQIAPLENPGVAEAHIWIAQAISDRQIETDNPDRQAMIERHLLNAQQRDANWPSLHVWLARIYLQSDRRAECLDELNRVALDELSPSGRVSVAEMFARLGETEKARAMASKASDDLQQAHQEGDSLAVDDFLGWAAAAEVNGSLAEALDVLFQGLASLPDDPQLLDAIEKVGIRYFDRFAGLTSADWDQRLKILERLLAVLPHSEDVLRRLAELAMHPPLQTRVDDILQAQRRSGPLPSVVETTLGDGAVMRRDWQAARNHYRAALQQDPAADIALNNLAYVLAHEPPQDLDQALDLANQALQLQSENPHYLETRGQIYVLLGRWQEALRDLNVALNGLPGKREIHVSLAKVYRELGDEEMARIHAAQASR